MLIDPKYVPQTRGSNYPELFQALVSGRSKQRLGDAAGLKNFGVNLVKLEPGSWSSVRHWHSKQDEFVYILKGEVTLITNSGEQILKPGDAVGFPAGEADGHNLINHSDSEIIYLEIGDRTPMDETNYPDADLVAKSSPEGEVFIHRDGSLY